jgi:glycosyltransferase involved in cell wall biosynthesis
MNNKICLVSRRFDQNCGSAEWIYAEHIYRYLRKNHLDVKKIEQKIWMGEKCKMIHDFLILPAKLLGYRFRGYRKFFFIHENQAIWVPLLNKIGCKTTTFFHDIMNIKYLTKKNIRRNYFFWAFKRAIESSNVIYNSTSTKKDVESYVGRSLNSNYSIMPPIYRKLKMTNRKKNGRKKIIGYLGALGGRKRTDFFMDLAREIKGKKIKNLKIEIWGKGYFPKISSDLKEIVELKGFAPENRIEEIYNSFDFFVFPSSWEGFGLPIIEAMMCGKPCFILKDGEFPKEVRENCIICNSERGILIEIEKMNKNRNIYLEEKNRMLKNSEKFNRDKILKKVYEVLK